MDLHEFVERRKTYLPPPARKGQDHPQGWEPGVVWSGSEGTITSRPQEAAVPQWDELLASWGFDPELYMVLDDTVEFRAWDANLGRDPDTQEPCVRTLYYFKAKVTSRVPGITPVDARELIDRVRKHKPRTRTTLPTDGCAMVACLSDWQLGKPDGDGTEGTVERILASLDNLVLRLKELKRVGRPVSTLYLALMGDITENCDNNYATQTFTVELNRRDQELLALDLLMKHITTLAPHVERLVVTAVGGNHGEHRRNGKKFTNDADNSDVTLAEQAAIVTSHNPDAYQHVTYVIPDDDLVVVLNIAGTTVAFSHGHLANRGTGSTEKARAWWSGQVFGNQSAADAQLLITAHYHHFAACAFAEGRSWLQCPTQDGGSKWYSDVAGVGNSPTGMLTFCLSEDRPGFWHDLAIV